MGASVPGTDPWSWLSAWPGDPLALAPVLATGSLYAWGLVRVRRAGARFPVRWSTAFWCGLGALAVALLTPVDAYAEVSFSIHMTQHLLLTFVAPPLLALGAPITLAIEINEPADNGQLIYDLKTADGRPIVSGRAAAPAPGTPLLLLIPSTLVGPSHYSLSVHDAGPSNRPLGEYRFAVQAQ